MIASRGMGTRRRRLSAGKIVILLPLSVAAGLILLTVVLIVRAAARDGVVTQAADLGQWAKAPVQVRVPIVLGEAAGLWLLRGDVGLHNARIKEPVVVVEPALTVLSQPLHFVERIVIDGGRLWLNAGRAPRSPSTVVDPPAVAFLLEPLKRLAFETLVLRNTHLVTQRPSGGQQTIEDVDADVTASARRGVGTANGRFTFKGESVTFAADLRQATSRNGHWSVPARIKMTSRHASARFDGIVRFDAGLMLDGRLEISAPSLSTMAQWLGFAIPAGTGAGAFAAKGEIIWRDGVLAFEKVETTLDGQVAYGALSVSLAGHRPFIDGALAFTTLDAGKVASWLGYSGLDEIPPGPAPASVARPARLPLFQAIDADLRLSSAHVTGLGTPTGRVTASLTARSGLIVADIAEVEIGDGTGAGQLSIDQRGTAAVYRARGSIAQTEASALLAVGGLPAVLRGVANIRFELAGRGDTFAALARSATGEATVSMPAGGRGRIDLTGLLADARERRTFPLATYHPRDAEFEHMEGRFAIRQGVVLSEHFAVRHDGVTVTADGRLQTISGRVYLRLLSNHGQGLARTARLGRSQSVLIHGELGNATVLLEDAAALPGASAIAPAPPAVLR